MSDSTRPGPPFERTRLLRAPALLAFTAALAAPLGTGCSTPAPVAPPPAQAPAAAAGAQASAPVRASLTVRGVSLATLRAGTGPLVVFVHGSGGNVDEWTRAVPALAEARPSFTALGYSRRFHPPNALDAPGEYSLDEHVEDLAALINAAGFESAHVVGSSYGGSVALELARRFPAKVRSLVLGEAAAFSLVAETEQGRAQLAALAKSREPIRRAFAAGELETGYGLWFDWVSGQPGAWAAFPRDRKERRLRFAGVLQKEYASPEARYLPPVACSGLPQLGPRTLVLQGAETSPLFEETCAALLRCMPGARSAVVPAAGHVMHLQNPVEYQRILLDFLHGL